MAPRVVSGPEITGLVTNQQTGTPIGGATVTVSATVYTDPDFTSGTTTLTADGTGVFFCYASRGTYTFTTTAAAAGPIESVTVRGSGGGGGSSGASAASSLTPTAIKTAPYTAAVGDLALMNVPGGATTLTLPTAPADGKQVGYRAIGATTAVPLTVTAGGSDTIGLSGATSATVILADETVVLQYQASATRWLGVSSVTTTASRDAHTTIPDWAANTAYAAGQIVSRNNGLYRRRIAGTSGATFDSSFWSALAPVGGRIADMPMGTLLAHRGAGEFEAPEHTMETYRQGVASGAGMIDTDLWLLPDGSLIVWHGNTAGSDQLLDLTTVRGTTVQQSAQSWSATRISGYAYWPGWYTAAGTPAWVTGTAYAANQLVSNSGKVYYTLSPHTSGATFATDLASGLWAAPVAYPEGNKALHFSTVLTEFGNNVPILAEGKNAGSCPAIAKMLVARGLEDCVMVQSFSNSDLVAAGAVSPKIILCQLITSPTQFSMASLLAQGINWVCFDLVTNAGFDDAAIATIKASGMKIIPAFANTNTELARFKTFPSEVIYTSNVGYLNPNRSVSKTDNFVTQMPSPGLRSSRATATYRGVFTPPNKWSMPMRSSIDQILMGSMCPIGGVAGPVTGTYAIDFDVTFVTIPASTNQRLQVGFASPTDDTFSGALAGDNGYLLTLRASGQFNLYKVVNGVQTSMGVLNPAAPVAGQTIGFKIDVTPTTVKATRKDTSSVLGPYTESTNRGGYFYLGKVDASTTVGMQLDFANVVITP